MCQIIKKLNAAIGTTLVVSVIVITSCNQTGNINYYKADHPSIQYTGRIDFSNPELPRFWNPGVYLEFSYKGDSCYVVINDELPWGNSHNYLSVVVDEQQEKRIRLSGKADTISIGEKLDYGKHKVTICKSTESNIGYIEFGGIYCNELLKPEEKPMRKIEYYGNSITCGTGSDTSSMPCNSGEWHDNHNAYMSYGPVAARALNAQWMITAVSGIGMIHSCCNMDIVMPDVYDKVNLSANQIPWDFSQYQPDVVTIALGQNDGIQDSTLFCSAYVDFIHSLRSKYPTSKIICLTSPMDGGELNMVLRKYISSVVNKLHHEGDNNIHSFFFSRKYDSGCDYHPTIEEHALIAEELTEYLRELMNW